ncbi:MAG TPA: ribosome-associated translation inhibitor RaiA [Acidobacteriota bacterium]|jgi:putative sigma-54 modulation protein
MKLEITGRHTEITPALRAFIEEHLEKIPRVLGNTLGVHVILTVEKKRHICEIILKSKTGQLTTLEETSDMYTSITRASHKMEKQVLKTKKKKVEVKRRKATPRRPRIEEAPPQGPAVIEESISKKPMAIEEALLNLNESRNGFVVYRDSESRTVSVVYRRRDGNIGLIRA